MIESIQIKNFKSVVDLSLKLGSFNVLIGENGCGKSNILEAIAFGAAASADKLDFEFLGSRGIRLTNSEFMFSAFAGLEKEKVISLSFEINKKKLVFDLIFEKNKRKWIDKNEEIINGMLLTSIENSFKEDNKKIEINIESYELVKERIKRNMYHLFDDEKYSSDFVFSNYIIYVPEQSILRKYEETNQIYPLGIKGEGLLPYLKELALNDKYKDTLIAIKQNSMLLDWYEDFDLPDNTMRNDYSLKIKDKYLDETLQYFDQRSTNEGFLFLLFYSTLFISKDTPTFFAIDNIDTSFNPKLCIQLTKNLAALAKQYYKQVIVTTHNPAILDGLDLADNDQRLFVVRRNEDGHTKAKRIDYKEDRTMKLSEIWTNGYIGGLPQNF